MHHRPRPIKPPAIAGRRIKRVWTHTVPPMTPLVTRRRSDYR